MDMSLKGGGVVHLTGVYSVPQLMLDPPQEELQGILKQTPKGVIHGDTYKTTIALRRARRGHTSRSEVARVGVTHIPTSRWPDADCTR